MVRRHAHAVLDIDTDRDLGIDEPDLVPTALTTEHSPSPMGISDAAPRLGWINAATKNGVSQSAYEIRMSSEDGVVWESGKVESTRSYDIEYAGDPLESRTSYEWSVRVWDGDGDSSDWSDPATFETAFVDSAEFEGEWISRALAPQATELPEALLRTEFDIEDEQILAARAYVAGLGYHKLYVNGDRIGERELAPSTTAYHVQANYVTYDVTEAVRNGSNAVGVSLGRGFYSMRNPSSTVGSAPWFAEPTLKLHLVVTLADGSEVVVMSDESWRTDDGPTVMNSLLQGESYDARNEQPGWDSPGFDDSGWSPAVQSSGPAGALEAESIEPIKVVSDLAAPRKATPASGVQVYDFQTTVAGWARVSLSGPEGATVVMRYGEKLNADGTVDNASLQTYSYTMRGDGVESFTPSYSYAGFRYLQVDVPSGVEISGVDGQRVNNAVASSGAFESSSELLNRYHAAMRNSTLSNFHSIPTDTPMYEKQGWAGDSHWLFDSAMLNFDAQKFFAKWMDDHRQSQRANGLITPIVPGNYGRPLSNLNDPTWAASYILVNWGLYQYRGDTRVLVENYDGMKRWLELQKSVVGPSGAFTGFSFGDWVPPTGGGALAALVGHAYLYECAVKFADIAQALGHDADAKSATEFAELLKASFNTRYYKSDLKAYYGDEASGYKQTENVLPLELGLVPEADRDEVMANLIADVHETHDDHLSTGAAGTKYILPVLTAGGAADIAYKVATNPTYPGWGYWFQTVHGNDGVIVDSMWEEWHAESRSRNHAFLGTIDDWLFEDVAGIEATGPGYSTVEIAPTLVGDLTHASAHITSPLGVVSSAWKRNGEAVAVDVEVPVGSEATVKVPISDDQTVIASTGERPVKVSDGLAVFVVGAGTYSFRTIELPAIEISVASVCNGSRAFVSTTVKNGNDFTIAIQTETAFGNKARNRLAPGREVVQPFNSRASTIGPGEVLITAIWSDAEQDVTHTWAEPYDSITCK
jgi:alpha-L-rhamnosidase